MTAKLNMTRDINGYPVYGLVINDKDVVGGVNNYSTTLAASSEQHFTVPADYAKWGVIFSFQPGTTVWVACNDTAAIPSSSFATTSSQLNPSVRQVNGGDILSFITDSSGGSEIGISLYAIS